MLRKVLSLLPILFTIICTVTILKIFFADILYRQSQLTNSYPLAKSAKNLFPDNPHILLQLARTAARQDKPAEAITYTKLALSTSPSEINFYKLASGVYNTLAIKQPSYLGPSLDLLLKAQTLAPTDPVLTYQIGNLYFALGRYKDAEVAFTKALDQKPNFDNSMIRLSEVYVAQKRYPEAKQLLESAIKINPKNKEKLTILDR
jgi:tetratricopeptide (TPR) repeat protein